MRATTLLWCWFVSAGCAPALSGALGIVPTKFEPKLRIATSTMLAECVGEEPETWKELERSARLTLRGADAAPVELGACSVEFMPARGRVAVSIVKDGHEERAVVPREVVEQLAVVADHLADTDMQQDAVSRTEVAVRVVSGVLQLHREVLLEPSSVDSLMTDTEEALLWAHHLSSMEPPDALELVDQVFDEMRHRSPPCEGPEACFHGGQWATLLDAILSELTPPEE